MRWRSCRQSIPDEGARGISGFLWRQLRSWIASTAEKSIRELGWMPKRNGGRLSKTLPLGDHTLKRRRPSDHDLTWGCVPGAIRSSCHSAHPVLVPCLMRTLGYTPASKLQFFLYCQRRAEVLRMHSERGVSRGTFAGSILESGVGWPCLKETSLLSLA